MINGIALPNSALERVTVAGPAAGNDFLYALPEGFQYMLQAVIFTLNTAAGGGLRWGGVDMTMQGRGCSLLPTVSQAGGLGYHHRFYIGINSSGALLDAQYVYTELPYPFIMQAADTIGSEIRNIAGGDTVTNIDLFLYRMRIQS